jgi:hypothetical protein
VVLRLLTSFLDATDGSLLSRRSSMCGSCSCRT